MSLRFRRGGGRRQLEDLHRQIAQLRDDVEKIEQSLGGDSAVAQTTSVDHYVRQLRMSMAEEDLAGKRSRLETLVAEAAKLEAELPKPKKRAPPAPPAEPVAPAPPGGVPARRSRRRPVALIGLGAIGALVLGLVGITNTGILGSDALASAELAPAIGEAVVQQGQTFFTRAIELDYSGGQVFLSGSPAPTGSFSVDDGMVITVTHPDGSASSWTRTFNVGCEQNTALPAQDVTDLFRPGRNSVSVSLYDICGSTMGTEGPIFLSTRRP